MSAKADAAKKPQVNMHNDHVASCLCCKNLYLGYEEGYSDVTPGDGWYCDCLAGVFCEIGPNKVLSTLHALGPTCTKFKAYEA